MKPEKLFDCLEKSKKSLKGYFGRTGLLLGTGLGVLEEKIQRKKMIHCSEIEAFPNAFQDCDLVCGEIEGEPVLALEGNPVLQSSAPAIELAYPVWLFAKLGVQRIILSAAGGSLDPKLNVGSLLVVEDHLNFTGTNPLVGVQDERVGPLFLDLNSTYDRELASLALKLGRRERIPVRSGTIAATLGPTQETLAEKKFFRSAGADALVQSLVFEAIAGVHAGIQVLGIVAITDFALPVRKSAATVEQMLLAAEETAPRLETLILSFLEESSR